jgi:hypothetical protein
VNRCSPLLPQAECIAFVPALYYPALSYTDDASSFYLYPLARRANSSKLTLMSSARAPAACCCSGLVSKLVSATASLAAAKVREGPQDCASTTAYKRGGAMAARLTLDQLV